MTHLPKSLIDLAKAYLDGDDSAFEPLIDCLLENGLVNHAKRIWWIAKIKWRKEEFRRSVVLPDLAEGNLRRVLKTETEDLGGNYFFHACGNDPETEERFKGAEQWHK